MDKNIERTKDGVDSLIDSARDAVVEVTHRAEHGVESVADRAVRGARLAGERTREGAETASLGAHRRVEGAATAIDQGYTRARTDLSRAAKAASGYVAENPGMAILLAASGGLLLGLLLRRPRRTA